MPLQPGARWLRMGTLDSDPGIRPNWHIFTASKVPWLEIADDLPHRMEDRGKPFGSK